MRLLKMIARMLPIIILVIVVCSPVWAREKTDVIVLKNGNHVSGEIKRLDRGLLTFKTDSMSTVQIKWEDIEQISSKYLFAVEDTAGDIYVGSLQPAETPRIINVVGPKPVRNLDCLSVVGIREFENRLLQRFSGSIQLGYTFTKASNRSQFNLNSSLDYRAERYEGLFSFDTIIGSSNGEKDVDRQAITFGGNRYFTGKWLLFSKAKIEHNLELDLDQRVSIQAGPGYILSKTHRSEIMAIAGMSYTHERYFEQEGVNNAEAVAGISAQFFRLYSPKIDLTSNFGFLPNLTTSGRLRTEFDTKLSLEIFSDFFVNFSVYDSFDTKPPTETATKHDYGFVTGISWSFRR